MACRLAGAKPLFEPMLQNCYLDPWKQTSVKSCIYIFIQDNAFEIVARKLAVIFSQPQRVDRMAIRRKSSIQPR